MGKTVSVIVFAFFAGMWCCSNAAADGQPDTTFGSGGKVITDFGTEYDTGNAVAIQADGKIVVAGESEPDFAVARYDSTGKPDPSFGVNGKVTTDVGEFDSARSVVIQPDGKIVIAGSDAFKPGNDFVLVRYDSRGNPDPSFGVNGKVSTDIGTGSKDFAYSLAIQTDGKIVVAGMSDGNIAVVRYDSTGNPDPSFGVNGRVITDMGAEDDAGRSVAVQTDGKIVVAGFSGNDFAVVRYDSNGNPDEFFGAGGKVLTDIKTGSEDAGFAVKIRSDKKILVAGMSDGDFAVVCYDSVGNPDPSFSGDGRVTADIDGFDMGFSAALQSDDKFIVAGTSGAGDFALVRYDKTGIPDASFGTGGKVITDIGTGTLDFGNAVAVQSDGKIVFAGISETDVAVVRYTAEVEDDDDDDDNCFINSLKW